MANLTVTPEGTLTIPREFIQDTGMKPGGQVELVILSNGLVILNPIEVDAKFKRTGRIEDLAGFLAGKTDVKLTIEEMNEAIGEAAAEAGMAGLRK